MPRRRITRPIHLWIITIDNDPIMDHNGALGRTSLPEKKMPAEGGKYQTFEKSAYSEALGREQDEHTIEEISAAREAIAAAPHRPEPKKAYKLLPPIDATEGPEPLQ